MLTVNTNTRGGKREGSGRKTSGIGKKSINISIRISPEEKQIIEQKAKEHGKTFTRFLIDTALNI